MAMDPMGVYGSVPAQPPIPKKNDDASSTKAPVAPAPASKDRNECKAHTPQSIPAVLKLPIDFKNLGQDPEHPFVVSRSNTVSIGRKDPLPDIFIDPHGKGKVCVFQSGKDGKHKAERELSPQECKDLLENIKNGNIKWPTSVTAKSCMEYLEKRARGG